MATQSSYQNASLNDSRFGTMDTLTMGLFGSLPGVHDTSRSNIGPEQQALLARLIQELMGGGDLTAVGDEGSAYPGQLTAGMNRLQNTSLAALEEMAMQQVGGSDSTTKAAKGAVERAASGDFDEAGFEQMFKGSIQDPLIKEFREGVVPEITRRYSGNAAFGSDRLNSERMAVGELGERLGGTKADLRFKMQEASKARALQAAGLAPGLAGITGQNADVLTKLLAAGGEVRGVEQQRLTNEYNEFLRQKQSKADALAKAIALAMGKTIDNQSTSVSGSGGLVKGLFGAF